MSEMTTPDGDHCHQELLQEVRRRIAHLQEAIQQISTTKRQLQSNAHQAKSEIHSAISRQLESLRSREVWLLQQVELIQETKEDVLRQQKDQLHQAIGGLHNYLICTDQDQDGETTLDRSMTRNLERFDSLPLFPEETANVTFKADAATLRSAVHHFGKVDSQVLPMELAFAEPGSVSASLPKAFEDYEDEEHHVLYKTVQDLKPAQDRVIQVNFPKLSEKTQDWLRVQDELIMTPTDSASDAFLFPPFKAELGDWLIQQRAPASASLHQWLQEIKQDADIEDDDFEILSSVDNLSVSQPSGDLETLSSGSLVQLHDAIRSYFQDVDDAPACQWLLRTSDDLGSTYPYQTMKYFRDVAESTKDWLLSYETSNQEPRKIESPIATRQVPDIEDLEHLSCLQDAVTNYFQQVSCDSSSWLLQQSRDMDADVDEGSNADELAKMCRANEPCKTYTDCVCDDSCWEKGRTSPILHHLQTLAVSSCADWLLSDNDSTTSITVRVEIFPPFAEGASEVTEWLYKPVPHGELPATSCPFLQHFQEISTSPDAQWLKSSSAFSSPTEKLGGAFLGVDFSHASDESNKWLLGSDITCNEIPAISLCTFKEDPDKEMGSPDWSNMKEWLLFEGEEKKDAPSFSEIFSKLSDQDGWLLGETKGVELPERPNTDKWEDEWLFKPSASRSTSSLFACFHEKY